MSEKKPPDIVELQSLLHRATSLALDACDVIESEGYVDDEENEDFRRLIALIRKAGGLKPEPRARL